MNHPQGTVMLQNVLVTLTALVVVGAPSIVIAQPVKGGVCGDLRNHYGPFDYRKHRTGALRIVEEAHFTANVESLRRGSSSDFVGDDLRYTLDTSPNHHRALISMTKLAEKSKAEQPPHMKYTVSCYFERAVQFTPDDVIVRMLFAKYLFTQNKVEDAAFHLSAADKHAADNPFTHYNIGLVYLEAGQYDKSLAQAHKALAMGFARTELKERLVAAGKWVEPETADKQ